MTMTLIYGLAIAAGAVALLVIIGLGVNPERAAAPPSQRFAALGVLGFGLGGMSSSFGGWSAPLAFVAGLGGAAVLALVGARYGESGE